MNQQGGTLADIENSGSLCRGITLQVREFWYSVACFYGKRINVATTGPKKGGLSDFCRGCQSHHNSLNTNARLKFDVEAALKHKSSGLISNGEWTLKTVTRDISYSLVLRVLLAGGCLHIATQADIDSIHIPFSKQQQQEYLEWIKARTHHGFQTGAELILLCDAGMDMISFDRGNSQLRSTRLDRR